MLHIRTLYSTDISTMRVLIGIMVVTEGEVTGVIFSARQHAERANPSVRLSVRPSVTRVDQSKTVERIIDILSPSIGPTF